MHIREAQKRQNILINYLREMASGIMEDTQIEGMAIKFKDLYSDNFRHCYSNFFPIVVELSDDKNDYNLEYLTTNLECMLSFVDGKNEFMDLCMPLSKLSDHINLECARYVRYSMNDERVKTLETKYSEMDDKLKTATQQLNEATEQAKMMQTQYITILGIFAAIMLAFVGSFTFSTSVLNNVSDTNVFVLAEIALIVGLVFVILITILIDFIRDINDKSIKDDKGNPKINPVSKTAIIILLFLIIITGIGYATIRL